MTDKVKKRQERRKQSKKENAAIVDADNKKAQAKAAKKAKEPVPTLEDVAGKKKPGKVVEKARAVLSATIEEQFDAIRKTLTDTNKGGGKMPRALKDALWSIDEAQKAAERHIKLNV